MAVVVHNPKLGEIVIEPGEEFMWYWDMTSFGECVEPGNYAVGIDYSDIYIWIEDGTEFGIYQSGGFTIKLEQPFAEFIITD